MKDRLWHQRAEYAGERLDVTTADPDPVAQFRAWLADAEATGMANVNAMTLATADAAGRPSARMVLLKEVDERGFVFYSNYESNKAADLDANPHAALCFYWVALNRQVRVEGAVEKLPAADSDAYFASRPLDSRISAIASPQSKIVASRDELVARVEDVAREHGEDPPRPAFWGGYRVVPEVIELWQGQPSRLHDRVLYRRDPAAPGGWTRERLAP
jgi:pyridoxamine 5'-phosphate oxidase